MATAKCRFEILYLELSKVLCWYINESLEFCWFPPCFVAGASNNFALAPYGPHLGYVHLALDEFSTGSKIRTDASFTRDRSIFLHCSYGTIKVVPCEEHLNPRTFNRSRTRPHLAVSHVFVDNLGLKGLKIRVYIIMFILFKYIFRLIFFSSKRPSRVNIRLLKKSFFFFFQRMYFFFLFSEKTKTNSKKLEIQGTETGRKS